jgi:PAS domain-containing protein
MLHAKPLLLCAMLSAAFVAPTAARAGQTAAEGRLDLRDLLERLPGRYDNEPQRFFLEGMKRVADRPDRMHVVITRMPGEGPVRIEIAERDGDEHSAVQRRATWELSLATDGQVVARSAAAGGSCALFWQRRAGVFIAEVPSACRSAGAQPSLIAPGARLWLSRDELWRELPGQSRPLQLLRATEFDCFVAIRRRNGEPQAMAQLRLHDRGGTVTLRTDEEPARQLTLLLRHGLWPSVSGNNFVPLMNLYLYEGAERRMIGNGWATPESGRVGFGIGDELAGGQSASARCTRINP